MFYRSILSAITILISIGVAGCTPVSENGFGEEDPVANGSSPGQPEEEGVISLGIEHGPGFRAPDDYSVTFELSHVVLSRADHEDPVRYEVDETLVFERIDGEITSLEVTLVDQDGIPATTYDYFYYYGSIVEASLPADASIELEEGDSLERAVGSVIEKDAHKEHILQVGVDDQPDSDYVLKDLGMKALTW